MTESGRMLWIAELTNETSRISRNLSSAERGTTGIRFCTILPTNPDAPVNNIFRNSLLNGHYSVDLHACTFHTARVFDTRFQARYNRKDPTTERAHSPHDRIM